VQIQAWQAEEIIADVEYLVSRAKTEPFTLVLPNVEHDPGALRAAAAAAAASAIVDQLAPFVPREIGLRADGDRIVVQTPDGYGSGQRVGGRRGGDPWSALSAAQDAIAEFLAEPWPASRGEMPMLDASVDPDGGAVVTIDGIPARDWRR